MDASRRSETVMQLNIPKYLSPSALQLWLKDKEAYFIRYLALERPPKIAQTEAMAVGSAFDAYTKSFLWNYLNGPGNDFYILENMFERQVEKQNRDKARVAGKKCFALYKPALSSLCAPCRKAFLKISIYPGTGDAEL